MAAKKASRHRTKARKSAVTLLPRPLKILLVPDTHVPYHDVEAFALMLRAAQTLNNNAGPDAVVVLGDFFDCFELSTHEKDLRSRGGLADELEAAAIQLTKLEAALCADAEPAAALYSGTRDTALRATGTRCYYIMGNHENRVHRTMQRDGNRALLRAYLGAGVIEQRSIVEAMGMDSTWTEIPYTQTLYVGRNAVQPMFAFTHDVGKAGQSAHVDAARAFGGVHVAIGHTHRLASATHSVGGVGYTSHMLGWLGDAQQQSYMPAVKMAREWSLGFGVATLGIGHASIAGVPIQRQWDGALSCCVEGRIVL